MCTNFIYLCFIFILCHQSVLSDSIVQTHVLYRHGDRAPVESYPNDPYNDGSTWPEGFGQLTKLGKEMEYNLGNWLRKRYGNFISSEWKNGEVEVHSTDYDRTLMSAQCVLAAFYYPDNTTRFDSRLNWIPTPIHTSPKKYDMLMNVDESCPHVEIAKEELNNLPEVKTKIKENKKLFKYLTEKSGSTINSIILVDYLFDTLEIERKYNLSLPAWTVSVWSNMSSLSSFSFEMVAMSEKLKRLKAGPLLREMRDHMMNKVKNESDSSKLYMYSGHDTTVASILQGMGVYNGVPPPYASCVILELHRVENVVSSQLVEDYVVKVYYRNSSNSEPISLTPPGCDHACPLAKWIEINNPIIPDNWVKECHEDANGDLLIPALYGTILVAVLGCVCLITLVQLILLRRKHQHYIQYVSLVSDE